MKKRISTLVLALMFTIVGIAGCVSPTLNSSKTKAKVYAEHGGNLISYYTENVYYSDKDQDIYIINPKLPSYGPSYTCGVVAGTNIVAWYNKQYSSLIPGHTAGQFGPPPFFQNTWGWTSTNSYINQLAQDLSDTMQETVEGVTIQDYTDGLDSYVSSKGQTFTSTSLMDNGTLDYEAVKTALESGQLLSVFVDGYTFALVSPKTGFDIIGNEEYAGLHVMAVYGYMEIEYYDGPNKIRHEKLLQVHTGFSGIHSMLRLNSWVTLHEVLITHIS